MNLVVLGGSGHAKVVIATARAAGWNVTAVLDDDSALHGTSLLGIPIVGPIAPALSDPSARCVIAIGANVTRHRLALAAKCELITLVHPAATVHDSVVLGAGTVVFAAAVIQPESRIGVCGIVNTGASVDHDCVVGDAVHIAPGARLAGGIYVGDETLIGIGAVAIPSIRIGRSAIVGAGAAVIRDVPDGAVVTGVPARAR